MVCTSPNQNAPELAKVYNDCPDHCLKDISFKKDDFKINRTTGELTIIKNQAIYQVRKIHHMLSEIKSLILQHALRFRILLSMIIAFPMNVLSTMTMRIMMMKIMMKLMSMIVVLVANGPLF